MGGEDGTLGALDLLDLVDLGALAVAGAADAVREQGLEPGVGSHRHGVVPQWVCRSLAVERYAASGNLGCYTIRSGAFGSQSRFGKDGKGNCTGRTVREGGVWGENGR